MAQRLFPIAEAARKLSCGPEQLRSLARTGVVKTKLDADGRLLIDVPEAAVALGLDLDIDDDDMDMEGATLALILRRIRRLDIQTQRDRLAYETALGQVVPIDQVKRDQLARIRIVRAALLSMARSLPELLVGRDMDDIRDVIQLEAKRIIGMFAGDQHGEP